MLAVDALCRKYNMCLAAQKASLLIHSSSIAIWDWFWSVLFKIIHESFITGAFFLTLLITLESFLMLSPVNSFLFQSVLLLVLRQFWLPKILQPLLVLT